MTLNLSVTDDQFARYMRRALAIAERLGRSLDFDEVMLALQRIHDGDTLRGVSLIPVSRAVLNPTKGGKTADVFTTKSKSPFSWVDGNIARCLRPSYDATNGGNAHGHRMTKPRRFAEIASVVGGERAIREHHLFTPHEIRQLADKQSKGEEGVLLVNGHSNFFFVEGIEEEPNDVKEALLFVVSVYWNTDYGYWYVHVYPFALDNRWCAGLRVFLHTALDP